MFLDDLLESFAETVGVGEDQVRVVCGSMYSRMDQVKFVEDSIKKILRRPFLNTLAHLFCSV